MFENFIPFSVTLKDIHTKLRKVQLYANEQQCDEATTNGTEDTGVHVICLILSIEKQRISYVIMSNLNVLHDLQCFHMQDYNKKITYEKPCQNYRCFKLVLYIHDVMYCAMMQFI